MKSATCWIGKLPLWIKRMWIRNRGWLFQESHTKCGKSGACFVNFYGLSFFLFSWPTPPTKRLLATCHSWRDLLQPSLWVVTPFPLSIEVSPMVKTWDCGGILIQSANEAGLHTHCWLTANLTSPNQLVFQSKSGDEMNTFVRPCWSITLLASCSFLAPRVPGIKRWDPGWLPHMTKRSPLSQRRSRESLEFSGHWVTPP